MNTVPEMGFALVKILAMLFVVLAFLVLVFYLIRRFANPAGAGGRQDLISVLATHHLSPKEKLVLVNLAGKSLLIGVTPSAINTLHVLEEALPQRMGQGGSPSAFAHLLNRTLKGKSPAVEPDREGSENG